MVYKKPLYPALRAEIRDEIRQLHDQNKPIDRTAIKAKYTERKPELAGYIATIVHAYSNALYRAKPAPEESSASSASSSESSLESSPEPKTRAQRSSASHVQTQSRCALREPRKTIAAEAARTKVQPVPKRINHAANSSKAPAVIEVTSDTDDTKSSGSYDDSEDSDTSEDTNNVLLQEFKQDLAGKAGQKPRAQTTQAIPFFKLQYQFLALCDEEDEKTGIQQPENLEHASLLSPALDKLGYNMPSQFALWGKLPSKAIPDPRVMLNTNVPFSAFVCGVQGSGKSHTTSCIIENCSMIMPELGTLQKPISTLVLNFNEYSSTVSSQPSEAAFLASVLPQFASQKQPIPLRVLVSPTNYHKLDKMYSQIPNIEVRRFQLQPQHLNISMMLSLMSMSHNDSMPLYMAQVTRVLREMAMKSGGRFDYMEFRKRLEDLRLDRAQTPFLYQRLDLLDSYLDLSGHAAGDYFVDGTILDLSCPFVDQSTACILFRIAIDLFLYSHPSRGKMIVADEAHKYMTETTAAKQLTDTFLNIIRQQRHLGVRTVISTQEPTISPRLIDLCSITIIHRSSSPEWYRTIQRHVPIERSNTTNEEGIPDGLYRIASLRTGEAIVFAPSAYLLGEDDVGLDTKHRTFRMMMRKRITRDGGRTITCVR